jgi:peptidoglycan/xylan/chitin deacetylase (PgdA/CDA1 family)
MKATPFCWPEGKRAAISLTFDDGRKSQVEAGVPLLNRYGIRASFYIVPGWVKSRLSQWKDVIRAGHEVGNHTLRHPGTGNLPWARDRAIIMANDVAGQEIRGFLWQRLSIKDGLRSRE